jgi:hypothetical protein
MALFIRSLLLIFPVILNAQALQLAPPQYSTDEVFFSEKTQAILSFDLEKSSIHYAFSGIPTQRSPIYAHPITLRSSCRLRAISTHPDYLPSTVTEKIFIKVKYLPEKMNLVTPAHNNYPGQSAKSLFDLKKGSLNLHDGNWLGFTSDTIVVESVFNQDIRCKSILISTLSDLNAWVLPMQKITVFGETPHGDWQKIGCWKSSDPGSLLSAPIDYALFKAIQLCPLKTKKFRIEIISFGNLPKTHAGSGTPAWFFMDEIIFQ